MLAGVPWAAWDAPGKIMTTKLILIVFAAAAFGWGFSALVEHADQTVRPDNPRVACNEWSSEGCMPSMER